KVTWEIDTEDVVDHYSCIPEEGEVYGIIKLFIDYQHQMAMWEEEYKGKTKQEKYDA
ncbi:hypothetical protein KI387_039913, partial [Taxus chinensis]